MAILTDVPGLVVTIAVDDQDLAEYDDPDNDGEERQPHVVTKYIEAKSGARFSIAIRFDARVFPFANDVIDLSLSLDGSGILWRFYSLGDIAADQRHITSAVVKPHGQRYYRQSFAFAELHTVEGQDPKLFGKLNELGSIKAELHRINVRPRTADNTRRSLKKAPPKDSFSNPSLQDGVLPEKNAKGKAISHQAKLEIGGQTTRSKFDSYTHTYIDGKPIATVIFLYRSRAVLQGLGVVPRTPSPPPLEDRPIEELTADEMRELLKRQKAKLDEHARTKKEKRERDSMDSGYGDGDLTDAADGRRRRQRRDVEVVDLSVD